MSAAVEVNFDALVGPTHNYAGLSPGNLASLRNEKMVSNPREAALQGLRKMLFLADLGVKQAVLPPHPRPELSLLRRVGFTGGDAEILAKAHRDAPRMLAACYSASSMWAANAATVSPSADCADGRVHITPANLISNLHRSLEPEFTTRVLRNIFADEKHFVVHDPLPSTDSLADEGAANHTRLSLNYESPGFELFAYGRDVATSVDDLPKRHPARQTLAASTSIARLHQLDPSRTVFLRQHPDAIDEGVFHNDVICVGNGNILLYHVGAFVDGEKVLPEIARRFEELTGSSLILVPVHNEQITLADAVNTYFFNSQLISLSDGSMSLVAPEECREHLHVQRFIAHLMEMSTPIRSVHYLDLRQSMRNGGGPACLRLRVVLTEEEMRAVHPGIWLTSELYDRLVKYVETHYRESLSPADLADPKLMEECLRITQSILQLLGMEREFDTEVQRHRG